jgi:hypothetical protein
MKGLIDEHEWIRTRLQFVQNFRESAMMERSNNRPVSRAVWKLAYELHIPIHFPVGVVDLDLYAASSSRRFYTSGNLDHVGPSHIGNH